MWRERDAVLSPSHCVCSGINPRVKSGRFLRILPDYEHMEYRDVYTCRTYPLLWLRVARLRVHGGLGLAH